MKPYPVDPRTALHVARRIQRERPRDTCPPVMIFFIIFGLIFSASMAVILIHYLAKQALQ